MVLKRVRRRDTITWEPRSPGIRNEPLDTRVYATGALELFNPNFEMHKRRRSKRTENTSPMPNLKQPVFEEKQKEKTTEVKQLKNKSPIEKHSVSSGIIRRRLRLV